MKNATSVTVSAFSIIMGAAGIEHGIGEILQGNTAPAGLMFPSWPNSDFFRIVGGEPAMTIVPNLLVTGILAIVFSLAFLVWGNRFVQRKNGGWALVLLAICMLLFGGGIFPPVLGILIGILGTRVHAPEIGWSSHLPLDLRRFLGRIWPGSFIVCIIAWLLLFPGINLLGYFLGLKDSNVTIVLILLAFAALLVTIFSGFIHDSNPQETPEKA